MIAPSAEATRPLNRLLKMAVMAGVESAVRLHIDRGDDLDARDDRGQTPLMIAASRNKASVCQVLLDAGVDVGALGPCGRDALSIAISAGADDAAATIEAFLGTPARPNGADQFAAAPMFGDPVAGKAALSSVMSVPGIGLLTGATLLPVFQRLEQRGSNAVVAFFGMDPRPSESGKHVGTRRLSKHGDAYARKLLYTAAMAAVRANEVWKTYYERHRAKGLPPTAALVIVGRKLLRVAFALFKSNSTYDASKVPAH